MPRKDELDDGTLKALAEQVVETYADFDENLRKRRFPTTEFERFRGAVFDYAMAMQERDWLNCDVADIINSLQNYVMLACHNAPSDILWKIDQMEVLIFSGYDAYSEHGRPSRTGSNV